MLFGDISWRGKNASKRKRRGRRRGARPALNVLIDHLPSGNVSGPVVRDRDPPICDFFSQKKRKHLEWGD
jgi:hypothetical protein